MPTKSVNKTNEVLRRYAPFLAIAQPATADPNHYDRYWSNGQQKEGRFYFAELRFDVPEEGEAPPELEKVFTFRMRSIGYWHPYWKHGSNHRVFETGRESV